MYLVTGQNSTSKLVKGNPLFFYFLAISKSLALRNTEMKLTILIVENIRAFP